MIQIGPNHCFSIQSGQNRMSFAFKRGVGADKSQTCGQECQPKSRIVTKKSRKKFGIIEEDIPLYPINYTA